MRFASHHTALLLEAAFIILQHAAQALEMGQRSVVLGTNNDGSSLGMVNLSFAYLLYALIWLVKKNEEDEKDEHAKNGPGIEPPSNAVSVMTTPRRQRHTHRATGPDTTFLLRPQL